MGKSVFEASTVFGLISLIAILKGERQRGERILLICGNTANPEVNYPLRDFCRDSSLVNATFDRVIDLNSVIWPLIPTQWELPGDEIQQLSYCSLFQTALDVTDAGEIYVESIATSPSKTLCKIFSKCSIHVYADGMMVYSPTRFRISERTAARIRCLHYVDLVPEVRPLLLSENRVDTRSISTEAVRQTFFDVFCERSEEIKRISLDNSVVFIGQYLSSLNLMSEDDEATLYVDSILDAHERHPGATIYFKGHPSAGSSLVSRILGDPNLNNVDIIIINEEVMLEELLTNTRPLEVCGIFSTALFTAKKIFDLKVYSYADENLYEQLQPYENSNRIPLLVSMLSLNPKYQNIELASYVELVGSAMQPYHLIERASSISYFKGESLSSIRIDAARRLKKAVPGKKAKRASAIFNKASSNFTKNIGIFEDLFDHILLYRSELFDRDWYLSKYPDVRKYKYSAINHYLRYGCREGRNPSKYFSTQNYYESNKDVKLSGMNALTHYIRYGRREGRNIVGV